MTKEKCLEKFFSFRAQSTANLCRQFGCTQEVAEDCVSKVLCRLCEYSEEHLMNIPYPNGYFTTAVANEFRSYTQLSSTKLHISLGEFTEDFEGFASSENLHAQIAQNAEMETLARNIERILRCQKEGELNVRTLLTYSLSGVSAQNLANSEGLTMEGVRSRIHRTRKRLKMMMTADEISFTRPNRRSLTPNAENCAVSASRRPVCRN